MGSSAKNRRKSHKKSQTVDLAKVEAIVEATKVRALQEEEYRELHQGFKLLADLVTPAFRNDESTEAVCGGQAEGQVPESQPPGAEATEEPEKPTRKGGNGRKKLSDYPAAKHVEVAHPHLRHGQLCPCGCGGRLYRQVRRKVFRHFVGCPPIELTIYEMEELKSNFCDKVFSAPLPEGVGPGSYDATAISVLALSKYGTGLPLYRQAAFLGTLGVGIAASTQYELVASAAQQLEPVHKELVTVGAQGKLSHFDDTGMKILKFVRAPKDKRTGIHTTGLLSIHDDFQVALFMTGRNHAGENMEDVLKQRDPDLPAMLRMSDALSSNFSDLESDEDVIASCMAHGRRNFVKVAEYFPEKTRHVLLAIGTVYHNDKLAKEQGLSPEDRLAFHQSNSQPVMDELKKHLQDQLQGKTEPNSSLGKAMQYMLNHWKTLTLFLRVPGAPLDNNKAERLLKKAVLHRKNSLFYRTAMGAKTGDLYMSLIYTCQLNKINPFDYLTELQRNGAYLKEAPGDWLPWTYQATVQRLRGVQPPS